MLARGAKLLGAVVGLILISAGCYTSKYSLGSPETSKVDRANVGDFQATNKDGTYDLIIRNLDDHQYYVEYAENRTGEKKSKTILRMVGFLGNVSNVGFASLRGLADDGANDPGYLIMRTEISPDHSQMTIRDLKDDFFKGMTIDSEQKLRSVIADNMNNEKMYDGDAVVFHRVPTQGETATH